MFIIENNYKISVIRIESNNQVNFRINIVHINGIPLRIKEIYLFN